MEHPYFLSTETRVMRGQRRAVSVNAPGAGNQWSATPPGGTQWRVLGGTALITNSAAVANRFPGIKLTIQGTTVYENYFNNNIAASSVKTITYQQGTTLNVSTGPSNDLLVPFLTQWLGPGDTIASATPGFDAGDTYTNVSLVVEEVFFTNPQLELEHRERDERRAERDAAMLAALGSATP